MAVNYPSDPERAKAEHLAALNGKIEAVAPVAHPFKEKDLYMGGTEQKDVNPLVETKEALDIGDSHVLAVLQADFGKKPDGSPNRAVFTPFFAKKDYWDKEGTLQIVEAKESDDYPQDFGGKSESKGDKRKQERLNKDLETLGSADKKYRSINAPGLVDYQIHDVNPGRFVIVTITTADGKRIPVALNMMDRNTGMEGHIFVARYPESADFALLEQPKPVVGERKVGPPQGFAGPLEAGATSYAGLRDELGIDAMTRSIKMSIKEEDLATSRVDDRFFLMSLNLKDEEVLSRPGLTQNMATQLDKLAKIRMPRDEAISEIKDGKINGAHAVAGIALSLLDRGEIVLNPKMDTRKNGLILTQVRPGYDSTVQRITLPRGSKGIGEVIGGTYGDPTKCRDRNPIALVDKKDMTSGKNFFASYSDIYDALTGGQGIRSDLGVVETAAIFTYGLKRGVFVANF